MRILEVVTTGIRAFQLITSSQGAADAGKAFGLNSSGVIDISFFPPGFASDAEDMLVSETLSAGNWINIYWENNVRKVRKSNAGTNRPIMGFTLTNIASDTQGKIYTIGVNSEQENLEPGKQYFASEIPGTIALTPPLENGDLKSDTIIQAVGFAFSDKKLRYEYDAPIYVP